MVWLIFGLNPTGWSLEPGPVETKIRLMSEALRARDMGDFAVAKHDLEELLVMAPSDPAVRRLLAEVSAKLAAESAVDAEAEDLARIEGDRLRNLLTQAAEQRQTATAQSRHGNYARAIATLDATVPTLPVNPLTQELLSDLAKDRERYVQAQAKEGLRSTGRAVMTSSAGEAMASTTTDEVSRLTAKGRGQYLAGEIDASERTFRDVQARYPDNAEAADYLARIEQARRAAESGNRAQVHTQLLGEVDLSWQRPGIFQEREPDANGVAKTAPLLRKLEEIILPNVSFTKVEIGRVVTALSAASVEFDSADVKPKGVNIVLLDPAAKAPTVTITLRNTNLKRVLDFVTEAVGYQYEVQADAIVVRPGGEATLLDTAFFPVSRATVLRMTGLGGNPASGTGGKAPNPFSSSNASNEVVGASGSEGLAMKVFLQQAGVNFEAVPGSSLAYDGAAIIVTQTARNLERIRNILNRYSDIRQVEIEAKFMEVQEGALEELGVNWSVATKASQQNAGAQAKYSTGSRSLAAAFSNSAGSQQGSIVRPESMVFTSETAGTISPELNIPIINNAPQIPGTAYLGAGAGALANITGVIGEFDVNAIVRALAQKQGTDLLSAPKVTVLSGNPATMTVAQELRYPQSFGQTQSQVGTGNASGGGSAGVAITAGTPQEFAVRNVGVELKVTPTVEEDDYSISLDLNPKVTEFDGFVEYGGASVAISGSTTVTVPSGFYQPIFSVRDISTKVTIWDGATLIMGGLTREEVKTVNDKVPVLGDIPMLGRLFRSKGESAQKRNLLIFVTASLVSPGGSPKKQAVKNVAPNSLFQNPTIITPARAETRK